MFTERPREWPSALVDQACGPDDDTLYDAEGHRMAYLHALDSGSPAAAGDHLQAALDRYDTYPTSARPTLFVEAAFFEGAIRGDADAARRWLPYVNEEAGTFLDDGTRLRAQAAADWAAGQAVDETLAAAHDALSTSTTPGLAEAERDWIASLN
jgi:hypothetical protein